MKKYFLLLCCIVCIIPAFSQPNHDYNPHRVQHSYDDYMDKSRKLRSIGFVLLGAGLGAATAGIVLIASDLNTYNGNSGTYSQKTTGQIVAGALLFYAGISCVIGSIPVFIISGVMHHKAMQARISISLEGTPAGSMTGIPLHPFPALGLLIALN